MSIVAYFIFHKYLLCKYCPECRFSC